MNIKAPTVVSTVKTPETGAFGATIAVKNINKHPDAMGRHSTGTLQEMQKNIYEPYTSLARS